MVEGAHRHPYLWKRRFAGGDRREAVRSSEAQARHPRARGAKPLTGGRPRNRDPGRLVAPYFCGGARPPIRTCEGILAMKASRRLPPRLLVQIAYRPVTSTLALG